MMWKSYRKLSQKATELYNDTFRKYVIQEGGQKHKDGIMYFCLYLSFYDTVIRLVANKLDLDFGYIEMF